MAWSALPTAVFANWSEDGTNITLPIASVPELTAAEADAATGDSRKILYALCERIWSWWNALATADKATKMTITKSASINTTTGIVTNTYTLQFMNTIASQEVASET